MNYAQSVKYLDHISTFGGELGLENIKKLLSELGNPQNDLQVIHVAGTNGKGSTSTLISNILIASSYKVGLFNSPNILSYNEVISINNQTITDNDFAIITTMIQIACNDMIAKGYNHPTVFECLTAIAIVYYKMKLVDYCIIEVGLGGRLDATNVFKTPLLSVITSISMDHTEFLGDTIEKIATEKAGIIKKNCPVVLGQNKTKVYKVVKKQAANHKSPLYHTSKKENNIDVSECSIESTTFTINNKYYHYENLSTQLLGKHQLSNISTALLSIYALKKHHSIIISDQAIQNGISNTSVRCRCEYIKSSKNILIDGAHNIDSIEAFTKLLSMHWENKKISLIFGALEDKDVDGMLRLLSQYTNEITITLPISERAMDLESLEILAKKHFNTIRKTKDYKKAYDGMMTNSSEEIVCCVGSFYLVYPLRNYIVNAN